MDPVKPCRFQVGDGVSLELWDRWERWENRLGNCTVTLVERCRCESGYMVIVVNPKGRSARLDSNWLTELHPELPL